jgi:uncharacterized membrane protein
VEAPPTSPRARLDSIDLVRGVVMVLMLLDHARDFLHRDGLTADPTDPATTTPLLFLTRWVTHFCAPTFVFLAGMSARLRRLRGVPIASVSRELVARGLFLVALELVVLRPLIWFDLDPSFLAHLQVIWVIGVSMLVLAALVHAPPLVSALFGLVLVLGHDVFDGWPRPWPADTLGEALWALLHQKTGIALGSGIVFVQYPLVPWVGVMALGYAAGGAYALARPARRRRFLLVGLASLALFLVLRALNAYGDPRPWEAQGEAWRSVAAFLAVEKYPPSLHFLGMTLGPLLVALAALDGVRPGRVLAPLLVLGRVPLFFYVLQWPTVHLLAWLFQAVAGQPIGWEALNPLTLGSELPPGCGFGLGVVYLGWGLGLALLVPLCWRFAAYERQHPERRWLRYF